MASTLPPLNQPPPTHTNAYRSGPQLYARPTPIGSASNQQQPYTVSNTPQSSNSSNQSANAAATETSVSSVIITVFVGNISERAPESMIKKILATVGTVISWKRVSTFGFCEYE